jgi:hypothetical protein
VQEKVLGKTHPHTLGTIMNIAIAYEVDLKDFTKAEGTYRLALDGHEKSLWKNHANTRIWARNLAISLSRELKDKKTRDLVKRYPHILTDLRVACDLLRGEEK